MQPGSAWRNPGPAPLRHNPQRQPFNAMADRSFRTNTTASDHSNSAGEVERLLAPAAQHSMRTNDRSWSAPQGRLGVPAQRGLSSTLIYLRSAQMTCSSFRTTNETYQWNVQTRASEVTQFPSSNANQAIMCISSWFLSAVGPVCSLIVQNMGV